MKKFYTMLLICLMMFLFLPSSTQAAKKIMTVKCDGQIISNEKMYAIEKSNGTVIMPYKLLSKAVDITKVYAKWTPEKKHLEMDRNNINLVMYGGKKELTKNNEFKYELPCALLSHPIKGKKYIWIPAEKICRLLGFKYSYNAAKNTLTLKSKEPIKKYTSSMTTKPFLLMSTEEFVEAIGPIAQREYHRSGMLASVTIAQAINESWSGVSYLAQKGNNLFGMKCYLSGNNWPGTTWRGKKVVKKTKEQYGKRVVTITDSFRKYDNVGQSFRDHSAYFLNAKNEYGVKRYKGIADTKSYKKQIAIIMKGGYCTFDIYGETLIGLIEEYNLTRFDK